MAKKYNIEYVNFYTDGSTARKIAPALRPVKEIVSKPRTLKRKVLYLDPVAVLGITVAVCMLIVMLAGLLVLYNARSETAAMQQYVDQLETKNSQLSQSYADGYDLEEVERTALALGMVPRAQVQQIQIRMAAPPVAQVQTPTVWEQISIFLTSLFA